MQVPHGSPDAQQAAYITAESIIFATTGIRLSRLGIRIRCFANGSCRSPGPRNATSYRVNVPNFVPGCSIKRPCDDCHQIDGDTVAIDLR